MITDKVDGDIARSRNLVTDFGKIADPIADKALTGHGVHRAVDHRRAAGGGSRSSCWCASGRDHRRGSPIAKRRRDAGRARAASSRRSRRRSPWVGSWPRSGLLDRLLGGARWRPHVVALGGRDGVAVVLTLTSGWEFARDVVRNHPAGQPRRLPPDMWRDERGTLNTNALPEPGEVMGAGAGSGGRRGTGNRARAFRCGARGHGESPHRRASERALGPE